jgi:thiol-disulfide isomerase/thioredoxin
VETLVVGGTVLCALVVLNPLLTLALIKRMRSLQESMAGLVLSRDPALPQPGEKVGRFSATTVDGAPFTEAVLQDGKTLVGFFAPGCRPCASLRAQLLASPPPMPLMAFVEGAPEEADAMALGVSLKSVARVAFLGQDDSVTRAIKQAGFPTLVIVERGVVTAAGHYLHEILP